VASVALASCAKPDAAPALDATPGVAPSVPAASAAPIDTWGSPGRSPFDPDAGVDTWHGLGAMEGFGSASGPDYEASCPEFAKAGATRDAAFTVSLLDGKASTAQAARVFEEERGARLRCCVMAETGLYPAGPQAGGFEVIVAAGVVSDAKQIRSPYELSRFLCVRHVLAGVHLPSGGDARLAVQYVVHPTQ
jgi:hypothetical protein